MTWQIHDHIARTTAYAPAIITGDFGFVITWTLFCGPVLPHGADPGLFEWVSERDPASTWDNPGFAIEKLPDGTAKVSFMPSGTTPDSFDRRRITLTVSGAPSPNALVVTYDFNTLTATYGPEV